MQHTIYTFVYFQPQYLIKYKGYPDSENTWEPPNNLNCTRLIRQFEKDLTKKKADDKVRQYFEFERIIAKRTVANNKVSALHCKT